MYAQLGTKVDVVEMLPGIVPFLEPEVHWGLQRALAPVEFHLNARVDGVETKADGSAAVLFADTSIFAHSASRVAEVAVQVFGAAIKDNNFILFLEHKLLYTMKGKVPKEPYKLPLYGCHFEEEGRHLSLVDTMAMMGMAREVATELKKKGIEVEIINPRTLFPLDKESIRNSVAKTGRLVILQEGQKFMGSVAEIGAMVAEANFEFLAALIKRVTSLDVPVAFSPGLEDYINLKIDHALAACRAVLAYQVRGMTTLVIKALAEVLPAHLVCCSRITADGRLSVMQDIHPAVAGAQPAGGRHTGCRCHAAVRNRLHGYRA